jgi:tyrosyl-DNA phosphodiesterase 2
LEGEAPGYTEDTDINLMRLHTHQEVKQVRFDRILLRSGKLGWVSQAIKLLGTQPIGSDSAAVFPFDHFGLVGQLAWVS